MVIGPDGDEITRLPQQGQEPDPPFDGPASVAFAGESVLVTNQSFPAGNPDHWAVFDVFAAEPGLPLFRPRIAPARPRPRQGPLVVFRFDRRRVARDRRAPFTAIVHRSRPARRAGAHRVTARVRFAKSSRLLKRRVRTCARR